MRLLRGLGAQLWKHPLLSGIFTLCALIAAESLAEKALPGHTKTIEHVGPNVGTGLILLVILLLIIKAAWRTAAKETSTTTVVVCVVGCIVYFAVFQLLAAILASSGNLAGSLSWFKSEFTGGAWGVLTIGIPEAFLQVGMLILLIIIPFEMHEYLPWDHATKLSRTLLPAWQAAAAGVMTWIDIVLLHFAGGPLASTSLPVLLVAGFGVATLLVPLYHFIARSCWQYGASAAFDPMRWHDAVKNVRKEVNRAQLSSRSAQFRQPAYTPNPRADSDPQDNGRDPDRQRSRCGPTSRYGPAPYSHQS